MSAWFSLLTSPPAFPASSGTDRLAEVCASSRRWVGGAVLSRCRYDQGLLGDGGQARLLVLDLYGSHGELFLPEECALQGDVVGIGHVSRQARWRALAGGVGFAAAGAVLAYVLAGGPWAVVGPGMISDSDW